jgi:hypothetical protein
MPRLALLLLLALALAGCAAQPAASAPAAPTAPPPPSAAPAAVLLPTVAPPTATALPPTATALPPTATALPPTATALPPTAAPAARGDVGEAGRPVRLVIPAINLDRKLLSVGLDRRRVPVVPDHDIGWYNLSAAPGQGENIVLWGHVLRFRDTPKIPAPFARLKELAVGARLTLYSADGTAHPYVVVEKVQATPDQVEYMLPRGRELLTLISCIGDKVVLDGSVEMTHRLITIAAPAE